MDKVKQAVQAGVSIPAAIKDALGMSVQDFTNQYNLNYGDTLNAINGRRKPTQLMLNAFIAELGGTEDEWRLLLWKAGEPEVANGAA